MLRFDEIVHRALSSEIRRELLLSLAEGDKYLTELALETDRTPQTIDFHLNILTEIGLVSSKTVKGKKYYSLRDRKILRFLRERRPLPPHMAPKPPHEIMLDLWEDMTERLDRIEAKIDKLAKRKR